MASDFPVLDFKIPYSAEREAAGASPGGLPHPDPPGWRLRRVCLTGGLPPPPDPPDWRLRRAGGA
eukprot:13189425-Alexandrium_andersonii.AAC.1